MDGLYEVMSPWAEADPVPLKGISPRLSSMADKTIGLFHNQKVASVPILTAVETRLKERFPQLEVSHFGRTTRLPITATGNDAKFENYREWKEGEATARLAEFRKWVEGVDGVIAAVGD